MRIYTFILATFLLATFTQAQENMMTPELLWKIKRLAPAGISKDGKNLIYSTTEYKVAEGEKITKHFSIPVNGGTPTEIKDISNLISDKSVSPDGTQNIEIKSVKIDKILGSDYYPEMKNSDVKIYDDLHYRHWDTWMDGTYNHLILKLNQDSEVDGIDLLKNEPYHSPQMPFGGEEDFTWNPVGTKI